MRMAEHDGIGQSAQSIEDGKRNSTNLKRAERSLRLVGVVVPTPRRATSTNIQFAIFNLQFFDEVGFTLRKTGSCELNIIDISLARKT